MGKYSFSKVILGLEHCSKLKPLKIGALGDVLEGNKISWAIKQGRIQVRNTGRNVHD